MICINMNCDSLWSELHPWTETGMREDWAQWGFPIWAMKSTATKKHCISRGGKGGKESSKIQHWNKYRAQHWFSVVLPSEGPFTHQFISQRASASLPIAACTTVHLQSIDSHIATHKAINLHIRDYWSPHINHHNITTKTSPIWTETFNYCEWQRDLWESIEHFPAR